ncbi:MAG TPA: dipeptide ABC transporter ATP-binding protein [Syntrophaceticus sp.]|jgi:oligopeptide transport system ATP-binding protein|uniref:Oligopeptide ABC transporter (ATP-binding protein) n=1 Tax=Syntrophaceticus schinkii TaxID=499207 RepID=A0A0B7MQJ6_9FIRM|nr:dipeptide ABC transporter ATP-binding protein [Syntrophaceticus schinkii]HHY31093.1 dipeptide ABC transporter ATP-binding protein [Syntrophaceticus sp.]MDD2359553.1 dipeptide ABC transporter ATP-binding protein [Syntrophaceticus schinkii]MDD4261549.1 dipeptide ABC transporter ATP-binding protein [Syntrophaceticus schinkii]MDD4674716.1 dipeptide ABC transporter ATP-binding protein [Syntrophaceticus schinkii]CEO90241.1 oligopeptide ABC transporter (ATP-binding protein) [Syntrophaceticus schin
MKNSENILEVNNLKKYFQLAAGFFGKFSILKAVDDISFSIKRGETLGLVGESGCGKTTVGRTLLRLYEPTAGEILFDNEDIVTASASKMRQIRRKMQMIFQDPYASLNPRMTVSDIIGEPLDIHGLAKGKARKDRVHELLHLVGLNAEHATRYPHEFSGGQRQRIGVARALAVEPEFIICDEPISALDVSIQAQVINLLDELQETLGLTYLFIAHDLAMVKHISDRIAVMYLGKIVEIADSDELFANPLHPYTKALLSAIPVPDPEIAMKRKRIILEGDVPSPINPPTGCRFRTRCGEAKEICAEQEPVFKGNSRHKVACHL